LLALQRPPDLLTHAADVRQIKVAIDLARCTDTDERQFRVLHSFDGLVSSPEPPTFDSFGNEFTNFRFDNGRFSGIYQVDLGRDGIHPYDLMPLLCKASRAYRTDITETEDAYSQKRPSFLIAIIAVSRQQQAEASKKLRLRPPVHRHGIPSQEQAAASK